MYLPYTLLDDILEKIIINYIYFIIYTYHTSY